MDSQTKLEAILVKFADWLETFGETSYDHQSYFAGPIGSRAKRLYYKNKFLGLPAVAPMIFSEAFLPQARRLFHRRMRFPIADAHYAMGFAYLYQATGDSRYFDRAIHFLVVLKQSRCKGYEDYCWGYPFDWVTRNGTIIEHTPFITSTPYMYEAFSLMHSIEPREEWRSVIESIARHVANDIKDFPTSDRGSTCSYSPFDKGGILNAASYRAGMLARASKELNDDRLWTIAERNVYYVLENQNADGSWYYATDGVRDFVDHFHTCFVMKGLAKVYQFSGHEDTRAALDKAWVSNVLVWVSFMSLLGCLVATVISNRFGLLRPLLVTLLAHATIVGMLAAGVTSVTFFISVYTFNFLWIFIDVYQMATVANVDHSGRFASLLPAAQGLGQIVGPNLAASTLALGFGYDAVFLFCAGASLVAFVIYAGLFLRLRRTLPALANAA